MAEKGPKSKSRNKVSVGEPAEGSLQFILSLADPRALVSSCHPLGECDAGAPGMARESWGLNDSLP